MRKAGASRMCALRESREETEGSREDFFNRDPVKDTFKVTGG